ncbi:MAG: SGNH/GDSL hydrolase family protein [Bacteroidales bacterium]|nr:SGNH/GDSL hydrolase family protein [Bacteroidales bacterium]
MRRLLIPVLMVMALSAAAQTSPRVVYTEASSLTLTGKLMDTPNPYHRVDTVRFKGFTKSENNQVRNSAGIAVAFRTNAKSISVLTEYGDVGWPNNTGGFSARGYDLYIKRDGRWIWAGAGVPGDLTKPFNVISNMDETMKECLMYLPILSEEYSVKIGVEEGSVLEPLPNPFRYRIGIFGSSFTHGISTSRAGMAYPAIFTRDTGLQLLSLGCSGNCKLQGYFADVLAAANVDAFIFDTFSNPSIEQIKERLFPFIEKVQTAHPGKPLIFQRTIYREWRNFNTVTAASEANRIAVVDSLMKIACKKYNDVYYIHPSASAPDHETTQDGTHPSDRGYQLWAQSIEKPVKRILRKYGIK